MPNTIIHKKSSTPGAVPASGSLSAGELAVNTADGVVYLKKDDGAVVASGAALSHTHSVTDITATGTPSATTYLRGDGAWAAVSGGGGGSTSASDLNQGTLANARLTTRARASMNLYLWSNFR